MKKKDFEQMIKLMNEVINLRHRLEGDSCQNHECCDDDDEEDEDEQEDEVCPIVEALKKDYSDFNKWVFGEDRACMTAKKAQKRWEKLHPGIPVPRVLLTDESLSPENLTIALIFDALPHYLEHKKKCNG